MWYRCEIIYHGFSERSFEVLSLDEFTSTAKRRSYGEASFHCMKK